MTASPLATAPPRHILRNSAFRRLWIGSAISLLGDQFYLIALPWVILQLTGSGISMGAIMMAGAIPRAILMLVGGAISDRISPRRIMLAAALARGLLVAAIGGLLSLGLLHIWHLYFLAAAFGVADAFAMPAGQAYLPLLVERDRLVAANSLLQSSFQIVTIGGPGLAALLVKLLGSAWAFFLDAFSFLAIAGALWSLPDPPSAARSSRPPMWQAIGEGIRNVRNDAPLSSLFLLATTVNFCLTGPLGVGLPLLASARFHTPNAFALMVSSASAGGLLGAAMGGAWKMRRKELPIVGGCAVLGVLLAAVPLLPSLWLIGGALFAMGAAAGLVNLHILAWVQHRVEAAIRGRVMSLLMICSIGFAPLSLAITGVLAQWDLKAAFLIAGAGTLLTVGVAGTRKALRDLA